LLFGADRLAVVCAFDRHVFQYSQAGIETLQFSVAQSAESLQAGRFPCPAPVSLFRLFVGRAHRRMAGPKLDGAISGAAE